MPETSIEYVDRSVNPIIAVDKETGARGHFCVKISPGCTNCYASRLQARFNMHEFVGLNRAKVEMRFNEKRLTEVINRKQPTSWFWCDMTDVFGDWVPDEWIDRCFATMALTPQHTHMIFTKRHQRMRGYLNRTTEAHIQDMWERPGWHFPQIFKPLWLKQTGHFTWPLPNVWLGVSVENQKYADERIPVLLDTPAAVRFVSAEPLLGPIGFSDVSRRSDAVKQLGKRALAGIDWVICGGESGPKARPTHPKWAISLRDQCQAAGVPFFFKQWGSWAPAASLGVDYLSTVKESKEIDGQRLYRLSKKAAGRLLAGREYSEMPDRSKGPA